MGSRRQFEREDRSMLNADLESIEVRGEFLRNYTRDLMKKHAEDMIALAQEAQEQMRKATEKERKENDKLKEQICEMTLVWAKERKMWRTEREAFSIEGC
jgi:23S rRNA pseudoU1915 N3-methylase RlmH